MKYFVFYANQLVMQGEHAGYIGPTDSISVSFHDMSDPIIQEISEGGYLYLSQEHLNTQWFRCNGTRLNAQDVPQEVRLLALLHT